MTRKRVVWIVAVVAVIVVAAAAWMLRPHTPQQVLIGAVLPLSGDAAVYGKHAQQGIELAVNAVNRSGGVGGRPVRVIYEDSRAEPKSGVSAFTKLATVDRVPAIIGPMGSSVALAVAPLANTKKVVLLSPTASAPELAKSGPYVFRNVTSDTFDGRAIARFCREELGLARAAVVHVQNDFGLGLKRSFEEAFRHHGGEIVASVAFEQGAVDFRAQITKVAGTDQDCLFLVGYKEMGRLLRQCHELGLKTQYLSFSMFEDPGILKQAGPVADGTYYTYRSYDASSGDEHIKGYVASFRQAYGADPDLFAALSYDAARILLAALAKGGGSPDELRRALLDTRDFPGVTGKTTFDENGDVVKPMGIKKVKDGEFVWVRREYPLGGGR